MIFQLILGAFMAYAGFYGKGQFSPILFVEGMILVNFALLNRLKHKSISHL
jgi:hypothetical protein